MCFLFLFGVFGVILFGVTGIIINKELAILVVRNQKHRASVGDLVGFRFKLTVIPEHVTVI